MITSLGLVGVVLLTARAGHKNLLDPATSSSENGAVGLSRFSQEQGTGMDSRPRFVYRMPVLLTAGAGHTAGAGGLQARC